MNTSQYRNLKQNRKLRLSTFHILAWQDDFITQLTDELKFPNKSEFMRTLIVMYHRDICKIMNNMQDPNNIMNYNQPEKIKLEKMIPNSFTLLAWQDAFIIQLVKESKFTNNSDFIRSLITTYYNDIKIKCKPKSILEIRNEMKN